jgi:hypothetical protein
MTSHVGNGLFAGASGKIQGTAELGQGPMYTVEENVKGRGCSVGRQGALLKGQQVWVRALIVQAGGPCPRWGTAVFPGLIQVHGAQAEFEAIPLYKTRGGGSSVLHRL